MYGLRLSNPDSPNPVTQVHIHDYQTESVRNWCVNDTHQLSPDVTVHVFTVRAVVSLLYVLAAMALGAMIKHCAVLLVESEAEEDLIPEGEEEEEGDLCAGI